MAAVGLGARARPVGGNGAAAGRSRAAGASRMAAARRHALQAAAAAVGPEGRVEPDARRPGGNHPARPDRGFSARPDHQPGHLPCERQPDAAHQGHRPSDPDRHGRDRTVPRRGLAGLRPDDVAAVHHREFLPRPRGARRGEPSRLRTRHPRRLAGRTGGGFRCFVRRHGVAGSPAAHRVAGGRRRALRSQIVRKPPAGASRQFAAAPLLPGRGLGRRHVPGAAALPRDAQLAHRPCRPGGRQHAVVRSHRRRRISAHRLQGQSAHAVRAGPRTSRYGALPDDCLAAIDARPRRRQRPRRYRARRPGEDHGAAYLPPSHLARFWGLPNKYGRGDEASPDRQKDREADDPGRRRSCGVRFCTRPTIGCSAAWTKRSVRRRRQAAGSPRAP